MRRVLLLIVILVFCCVLLAQPQRGVKGGFNTDEFPKVSFVWNSPNPANLERSMFVLTDENGKNVDFQFEVLPQGDTVFEKSVLFLWEDMKSHSNQSENTRKLLVDFFKKTAFDKSTRFNVAVFNRKSDLNSNVLKPLMKNFSSNTEGLAESVAQYKKSTRIFNEYPQSTDLYSAIEEGIKMLKKESGRVGIIVVVTAGLNMKSSGASTDIGKVLHDAVGADIPIYVVKYHQIAGNSVDVNSLAEDTYGQILKLTDGKVDEAVAGLQKLYKNLDANCYGKDYKFVFTSDAKRDGKSHPLGLSVNKVQHPISSFSAPRMTFGFWVKEHVVLFIFFLLLFAGLVVLAVWFIMHSIKKRRLREAENKAQLQQEIDKANQERVSWVNMQRQKEAERQRKEAQQAREVEESRLLQLMYSKNMYPRLQCNSGGTSFIYAINQLVTKIGRNENNDVVLPHQTVSGFHAEIRFNGTAFEVFNRSQSYKRGIIVNGQFFQQCTLKNGDMIGLGEAVITFYV